MTNLNPIVAKINDLPTLPNVVTAVNRLVNNQKTSAGDISEVLSQDMVLSAKILKLVNSPFYGFPRRITTITYAVVILGFQAVRNLAMAATVFDMFKQKNSNGLNLVEFWKHSIGVALASSVVSNQLGSEISEDAFTGGLLHDIGKAVMSQYMPDDMSKVISTVRSRDCLFYEAEQDVLTYNHATVGGMLLERWNLPAKIVEVVQYHHVPDKSTPQNLMPAIAQVADILVRSLGIGDGGDKRIPAISTSTWMRLGLNWQKIDQFLDILEDRLERADSFLSIL